MKRFLTFIGMLAIAFAVAVAGSAEEARQVAARSDAKPPAVKTPAVQASAVQSPAAKPPAAIGPALLPAKQTVKFSRDIEPILSANCYQCHGPDSKQRKAGLRLDQQTSATGKLTSGDVAIVPGKPDQGELVRRIFSTDADERMPPPDAHRQLASVQKDLLKRWGLRRSGL